MKSLLFILPVLLMIVACGNPVTLRKELDRSDKQRHAAEADNRRLAAQSEQRKVAVVNASTTTHATWTVVATTTSYSVAASACADLGFDLPTAAEISEFKTEVYDQRPVWQKISFERFFVKDVDQDWTVLGFVLCRRPLADEIF